MRDKEKKHRKGQESTIGKIIYGFLLFMPLIAIGVTCGYAMFNKNAYHSFESEFTNDNYEITNQQQVVENLQINFTYQNNEITGNSTHYKFKELSFNPLDYDFLNYEYVEIWISIQGTSNYIYLQDANGNFNAKNIWGNQITEFSLISTGVTTNFTQNKPKCNIFASEFKQATLSNVFYYAVDKVTESPLFNWAQNSIIYTTTNATCNALSITTPFIPLLMSYWLIISVIYFLYDIALMLVWLIHRKIHELQESL